LASIPNRKGADRSPNAVSERRVLRARAGEGAAELPQVERRVV
jgi:hypothetical protein